MAFLEKILKSKVCIWVLIVLPGLWPAVPLFRQESSVLADPAKYLLHHMGFVACVLLAVVLMFTPLRILWPKSKLAMALNRHRRLVGVAAFAYALLHVSFHVIHEGGLATFVKDVKKPFILSGLTAFTILLALAVTSPHRVLRRMGAINWKRLHRLAYIAAGLAGYHQAAARKVFPVQVLWIFVPLALLEIARIWRQRMKATAIKTG
ncbi:MAG: ferric reductase-like transmembrane domain-containing protein [Undibacterium sp.]|nr:ferric reductase-like transmembrane domain-containing protein [Opitutaceae bacterium]